MLIVRKILFILLLYLICLTSYVVIMKKYVAYYRVSTQKQGNSGLGLDSQKTTVINFVNDDEIIAEFTEVESGKKDKRVELQKAIEFAKMNNATLIIAKLDRLSRNVSFVFQLRDSNVDFICCDIPDANTMTIGIFALLAQQERELISERTKKALAEKKKQGVKLGSPYCNLNDEARKKSIYVKKENSMNNVNNKRAMFMIKNLVKQNYSYNQIARELNTNGFKTAKGNIFYPQQVKILALRIA